MKMMRRCVHDGREFPAIIAGGMPPALHPLYNPDILGKDCLPHFGVRCSHLGERIVPHRLVGIVDFDLFAGAARAIRQQQDGKGMILMDTEKDIREQRDIFRAGIPLCRQAGEIRKTASISADLGLETVVPWPAKPPSSRML